MRGRRSSAVAAAIVGLVLSGDGGPAAAQVGGVACQAGELRIRLAHGRPETGDPIGEALEAFAADVSAELDGRVCVHSFPEGALFADADALAALRRGDIELAAPSLSAFDGLTRAFRILELPFLFSDAEAVHWFQNSGPGQRLRRALDGTGLRGLTFLNGGMRQMSAGRPILAPQDLEGLVIWARRSEVAIAQYEALGASARFGARAEGRQALASGVVDGQEGVLRFFAEAGLAAVQDGVTITNHASDAVLLAVTEQFWESLPRDVRQALTRALVRAAQDANDRAREAEIVARRELEAAGAPVRDLDATAREAWIDAMRPVWRLYEAEIGSALLQAAINSNL